MSGVGVASAPLEIETGRGRRSGGEGHDPGLRKGREIESEGTGTGTVIARAHGQEIPCDEDRGAGTEREMMADGLIGEIEINDLDQEVAIEIGGTETTKVQWRGSASRGNGHEVMATNVVVNIATVVAGRGRPEGT